MAVAVLCLSACSDGVLKMPQEHVNPQEGLLPPGLEIVSFTAEPPVVEQGQETTLVWEVVGAEAIEITASGPSADFHYSSEADFQSSTTVTLREATTFLLTALKGEASVQASVTVTVRRSRLAIESFYAEDGAGSDPDTYILEPGRQTVLHWSVLPDIAVVQLSASTGEQPVMGSCHAATASAMELEGEAMLEGVSASGCAAVTPVEDTVYTLTAELEGETVQKTLSILVGGKPAISLTTWRDKQGNAVLAWETSSKEARVTLTASPSLPLELPVDQPVDAERRGSFAVPMQLITQPVTFTATAKVGGQTVSSNTVVVSPDSFGFDCSHFVVIADAKAPAFAGEEIVMTAVVPSGAGVRVTDAAGNVLQESTAQAGSSEVVLKVPAKTGGYTVSLQQQGKNFCGQSVAVPVAELKSLGRVKAVRVVAGGNPKDVYVGLDYADSDKDGYNNGKIGIVHYNDLAAHLLEIDFFTPLKGVDAVTKSLNPNFLKEVVKTFPVNAIAVSPKGRLFAATTGGIFYQDGDKWSALTSLLRVNSNGDYPGSHPTCFGQTQSGKAKGAKNEIVTLGQVCDLLAAGDKLYAATDRGLFHLDDVEGYIRDKKSEAWKGWKNILYGTVVNDVEVAGSALYAAGAEGVFSSEDGGLSWSAVGHLGAAAYSVTLLGESLVAATETGVALKNASGAEWGFRGIDSRVYSVAADPYAAGTLYAGTAGGFYVSRDNGETFKKVSGDIAVRSISVGYTGDPRAGKAGYAVYLATEQGVWNASLAEVRLGEEPVPMDDRHDEPTPVTTGTVVQ